MIADPNTIPGCCNRRQTAHSRRDFLAKSAFGFGAMALGYLESPGSVSAAGPVAPQDPLAPKPPHFPARAKSVIFLFMQGGASHVDTFDYKPLLSRLDGQGVPPSFQPEKLDLQFIKAEEAKLMASRRGFKKWGQSGIEISDLFANVARHADDLAVIRSCYHEIFIHGPALHLFNTGSIRAGHPSAGAWVVYGLGSETQNLPAYVLMADGNLRVGATVYSSGFLPAVYQGTMLRTEGAPIENLSPPPQMDQTDQRLMLDQVAQWNQQHLRTQRRDDSRLQARMANYELAFRMQMEAPGMMDISQEPEALRNLYGLDEERTAKFGRMCLLARRMVERGVRFVQLYNTDWDGHAECDKNHSNNAGRIDQPIAALLADLKQQGLLDSTLVFFAGEFGRTPVMQGKRGRDHNPYGFSVWMAGGGIRGGKVIGATDELGFRAIEDRVHVHDLHATMLSLLGLDHAKLTYFFQGRDQRLTDVGGHKNLAG